MLHYQYYHAILAYRDTQSKNINGIDIRTVLKSAIPGGVASLPFNVVSMRSTAMDDGCEFRSETGYLIIFIYTYDSCPAL
jgi:hypothetical protein